jgi:hypothetical protein
LAFLGDNLAAVIVPPLDIGSTSPMLTLLICALCLVGMITLGVLASRRRWNLVSSSMFGLWAIAVMVIVLVIGGLIA